jgi:hypothetical protein
MLFAAGELDFTFGGGDGVVSHPDAGRHMGAIAAVTLPDGKVVDADETYTARTRSDILLARYNADGTLGATFDGDGRSLQRITLNGSEARAWRCRATARSSSPPRAGPPPAAVRTSASSATSPAAPSTPPSTARAIPSSTSAARSRRATSPSGRTAASLRRR